MTATQEAVGTTGVIVPLDAATDTTVCGHKAATLAALRGAGFPVPDGFVVPEGADVSVAALMSALERVGSGPWAVRSSGVAEDLGDASFAGQYESVLGVATLEEIGDAISRVRESGRARHVETYRRARRVEVDRGVAVESYTEMLFDVC